MVIGKVEKKEKMQLVKFAQGDLFPASYNENYTVINHSYYIDKDGKSVWESSQIMWRIKK